MEGNIGSNTGIPFMTLDISQIENSYLEEKPEIHFRPHQFGFGTSMEYQGRYSGEVMISPTRPKRSGGRRSGNSAMDSPVININPTGIITYMSVEEARAQGLIEEAMETEDSQQGYSYILEGQDDSMTFGNVTGQPEVGSSNDEDDTFELDPNQFLRNMCFNPFTSYGSSQYKTKAPSRGRTFIPIRKSSTGMGKATATITGAENDLMHPFICDLCSEKFKKKLFLNNHMESRHGIKFVFTEKGKKVKLVRMPTQVVEGEKLDPCVRMLMDSNGNNAGNFIGVQPVETTGEMNNQSRNPTAHEVDPYDILTGKAAAVMKKDFGSALLVDTIRTFAMMKVKERGETPFVAYRPFRSEKLYLLSVTNFSKNVQLLMNATEDDLENSDGTIKVPGADANEDQVKDEDGGSNTEPAAEPMEMDNSDIKLTKVIRSATKFSHVAIVLYVEQVRDPSSFRQLIFNFSSVPITESVHLMQPDYFSRSVLQAKPKRLRCLSMPEQRRSQHNPADDVVTQKRKYTRRCFGRRRREFTRALDFTPFKRSPSAEKKPTLGKWKGPEDLLEVCAAAKKKKKMMKDAEDDMEMSDDEEADATYVPYRASGGRASGGRASGGGTGSGKRGRPRKSRT